MSPSRMNLTTVHIKPAKGVADVLMDGDFQAPRSDDIEDGALILRAQVRYSSFDRRSPTRGGDKQGGGGRLTFSRRYLDRKGFMPSVGDRIVKVVDKGKTLRAVNFRIVHVKPAGHLSGPTIVMVDFEYDKESRSTP